jgi:hypothetical protein
MRPLKTTTRSFCIVVLAIGMILGIARLLYDGYYEERIQAMSQLAQIDGITDIVVSGFNDVGYEVSNSHFRIAGRPDTAIVIWGPQAGIVGHPEHLWLGRLGPCEFHECHKGFEGAVEIKTGKPVESIGFSDCIDIGPRGDYVGMLPVRVVDVKDVVAHYDELLQYFSGWPDETVWGKIKTPASGSTYYCVTTPRKRPIPPPPQLPGAW